MYRTLMYIRHTHVLFSVIPLSLSSNHSLIPLNRPHFCPSWVRLRPFWYHLPLTRRSSTLLGGPTYMYARVHTYTSIHAPSRGKVLQVTTEGRDDKGGEEEAAEETVWGRGGQAYSGILRAARGRRWKKRCRFEERWGWGKRLNFYRPLAPLPWHVSPSSRPIVPRRVHSLQASSHGVTFLVGTPVPIFRRLHSAFLLDIIFIAKESPAGGSRTFSPRRDLAGR